VAKNKNEWCFVHKRKLTSDGLCPLCLEGIIDTDEKPNAHNKTKKDNSSWGEFGTFFFIGCVLLGGFIGWKIAEVKDSSSKQNVQSITSPLREKFNTALPQALELIQEKEYTKAIEILEKAKEVIKTPPAQLRSIINFRKEIAQLKKCFIALVLLEKIELSTKQNVDGVHSIKEEDIEKIVEIARQLFPSNYVDVECIDKFIQDDVDFDSKDHKLISAIYSLLRNKEWIKECYAHHEKLSRYSFRKFMITEVSLRKNGSPPPPAPKYIDYSSELEEIYDEIISPLNQSEHLLVYCMGNHIGIALGEKTVNNWLYGWRVDSRPLHNGYLEHHDMTHFGPWKTWDGKDLKNALQQKFNYSLYKKYK